MNKLPKALISGFKPSRIVLRVFMLSSGLLGAFGANADAFNIAETQVEKLKCHNEVDADTNKKYKVCEKITTGTYTGTIKISPESLLKSPEILSEFGIAEDLNNLAQMGVDISKLDLKNLTPAQMQILGSIATKINLDPKTVLALDIGDFTFSQSYDEAKTKPANAKDGTWFSYYKKPGYEGACPSSKCLKTGSVNLNFGLGGITIKFTGSSNSTLGYGQSLFAKACEEANVDGSAPVKIKNKSAGVLDGAFSIGEASMPLAINIQCTGVKSMKESNSLTHDPIILNNFTKITGKL